MNSSDFTGDPTKPTSWPTVPGTRLHVKTDFEIDDQGRITQELGPIHSLDIAGANTSIRRSHLRVYNDTAQELREASGYQKQSDSSYVLIEPITVSW